MDLLDEIDHKCWTICNEEFVAQIQRLEKAKVRQSKIRSKLSTDEKIEFDEICFGVNRSRKHIINQLKTLRDKHCQSKV